MGSIKAELRRFEKRRLRPILQRLKRRHARCGPASPMSEPMEQLLVALLRADIRRAEAKTRDWTGVSATLRQGLLGRRATRGNDLEAMVRTMLASASSPAAPGGGRDAA